MEPRGTRRSAQIEGSRCIICDGFYSYDSNKIYDIKYFESNECPKCKSRKEKLKEIEKL
jgi:hypothetical protein